MYLKLLLISIFTLGLGLPSYAETTNKKVEYDYTQSGTTYQLARIALRDKIFNLEGEINRKIIVFTAREDLNGDNVPEVLVKLNDKKFFCSEDEGCETFILAITEDGPVLIGSMKADNLYIEQQKHNNAHIITAKTNIGEEMQYLYENGKFIEKSALEKDEKKETAL